MQKLFSITSNVLNITSTHFSTLFILQNSPNYIVLFYNLLIEISLVYWLWKQGMSSYFDQ